MSQIISLFHLSHLYLFYDCTIAFNAGLRLIFSPLKSDKKLNILPKQIIHKARWGWSRVIQLLHNMVVKALEIDNYIKNNIYPLFWQVIEKLLLSPYNSLNCKAA